MMGPAKKYMIRMCGAIAAGNERREGSRGEISSAVHLEYVILCECLTKC